MLFFKRQKIISLILPNILEDKNSNTYKYICTHTYVYVSLSLTHGNYLYPQPPLPTFPHILIQREWKGNFHSFSSWAKQSRIRCYKDTKTYVVLCLFRSHIQLMIFNTLITKLLHIHTNLYISLVLVLKYGPQILWQPSHQNGVTVPTSCIWVNFSDQ